MTQEQIEAVRVRAIVVRNAAITFGGVEQIDLAKTVADDLDALATRLAEVERERDEARAWHQASQEALADQLEARSKLEAEVARCEMLEQCNERQFGIIATLRAAIAEAVRRADLDSPAECRADQYFHDYVTEPLRNLTKPEAPSERIMSDKDRENPVEGAHPTQPEPEDALVEALREVLPTHNREVGKLWAANLRKALASRGLVVRGEGVER